MESVAGGALADSVLVAIVTYADNYDSDNYAASDASPAVLAATHRAPAITGPDSVSYAENDTTAVGTYTVTREPGATITWSRLGADAGAFTLDGGVLRFAVPPNFEAPADVDADNVYAVTMIALLLLILGLHASGTWGREIDEPDSLRLELNPHDYIPLAVGNSWTYDHHYLNATYPPWRVTTEEYLKFMEIPGYPHGWDNPVPPESLLQINRKLTIEITHTEIIDGFEYYVFSNPDYDWPPMPELFWGGKKVRLSDEGFLVFRLDEKDVPLYELGHHYFHSNYAKSVDLNTYNVDTFPPMEIRRSILPENNRENPLFVGFSFWSEVGIPLVVFLRGYGLSEYHTWGIGTGYSPLWGVLLNPVSANIEGKEILYPYPRTHFMSIASVQPTSWGQLKRSFIGTK